MNDSRWTSICWTVQEDEDTWSEPKPISTRKKLYIFCVTKDPLWWTYKLFACAFSGAKDDDLFSLVIMNTTIHQIYRSKYILRSHVETIQGGSRCVTMDSAYMSDIMAQIGRLNGISIWLVLHKSIGQK